MSCNFFSLSLSRIALRTGGDGGLRILRLACGNIPAVTLGMNSSPAFAPPLLQVATEERMEARVREDRLKK